VKEVTNTADEGTKTTSTPIEWKENMDLVKKLTGKASVNGKAGKRMASSANKTFFSWFTNNDDESGIREAEMIKEDIWPNVAQWFGSTGGFDDMDDEEFDPDEDEFDDDEEGSDE
jgi:hypothetical protein